MRVQWTSEHDLGPPTEFSVPSPDPIWPSELHYVHAPGFEPGFCVQRLFYTLANHRTHNTRPHFHFDWRMGIGCAMAAERWVWTNEKPYFSYVEVSALLTYLHGKMGDSHAYKFTSEKTAAIARAVKVLVMDV